MNCILNGIKFHKTRSKTNLSTIVIRSSKCSSLCRNLFEVVLQECQKQIHSKEKGLIKVTYFIRNYWIVATFEW